MHPFGGNVTRTVYLSAHPQEWARALGPGREVLTTSVLTARALDVPHVTLGACARVILEPHQPLASQHEARECLVELLREGTEDFPEDTTPLLLASIRELLEAEADLAALSRQAGGRTGALARLAQRYLEALELRGRLDEAQACHLAASHAAPRPLLLFGHTSLRPGERALLNALASPGSAVVLPDDPCLEDAARLAEQLRQEGWRVERTSVNTGDAAWPSPEVREAGDRTAEARWVLGEVRRLLQQGARRSDVLLVARSIDPHRPALQLAARELNLDLHFHTGLRRRDTPAGAWLVKLARVLGGDWQYDTVLQLLHDPHVTPLDPGQRRTARQDGPHTRAAWQRAIILPTCLTGWAETADGAMHLRRLAEVTATLDATWRATLLRTVQASLPADGPLRLSGFAAALDVALNLPSSAVEPAGDALLVVPAELLPGAQAKHVFVLGLSEGVWPAPPNFTYPLDAHDRKRLALGGTQVSTVVTHARHEAELFWWAGRAATRTLTLSYPRRHGQDVRPPSPLLRHSTFLKAVPAFSVPVPLPAAPQPDHGEGVRLDLTDHVFSATQLTRFGQCAYRWYAQHALRLRDHEEPQAELAPHRRGRLYHRTLDLLAKTLMAAPDADRAQAVSEAFRVAEREEGVTGLPNWALQRDEHLRHLQHLAQAPDFLPDGHAVAGSEVAFDMTWHGFRLTGTLDRLDRTPDGYFVVDYKTSGSKPKGAQDERGQCTVDVQLPLYLHTAAALDPDVPVVGGQYYSLTRRDRRVLALATPEGGGLDALARQLQTAAEAGVFPAHPDRDRHACRYCAHDLLCRVPPHTAGGEAL